MLNNLLFFFFFPREVVVSREMQPLDEIVDEWQRLFKSGPSDRVGKTNGRSLSRKVWFRPQSLWRILMPRAFLSLSSARLKWYLDDDWRLPADPQRPVG